MLRKIFALVLAAVASVATATTLNPIQLLNPTGSTSGQAIISTGASTAPAWGNIAVGGLSPIAGNTVLANATGSSAAPTAFAMPSCSTSASALNWTTSTGYTCNAAVNAATLGGATFASPGAIGGTTAGSGAFTTLSAGGTVSGAGFTSLLSPYAPLASPTFTGTAAFASVTATGTITPSQTFGIVGTTTNNNANAGSVGEYVANTASGVSMTTATGTNLTSISLTAGDWAVNGGFRIIAAGGATPTQILANLNTTSGTLGSSVGTYVKIFGVTLAANSEYGGPVPMIRVSVSGTTTVYCVASVTFSSGTATGECQMNARRVR